MGNYISHYIGAYLEINPKSKTTEYNVKRYLCSNNHECEATQNFCPECGAEVNVGFHVEVAHGEYYSLQELLGEDCYDHVYPAIQEKKTIIVIDNGGGGAFDSFDKWSAVGFREINEDEISKCKRLFLNDPEIKRYVEILKKHESVMNVTVKFGIVSYWS